MTWRTLTTQQRIDAVKAVYRPGMSAAQIADALPYETSRNAIIGLIHRHGKKIDGIQLRLPPVAINSMARAKKVKVKAAPKPSRHRTIRGGRVSVNKIRGLRRPPRLPSLAIERELEMPKPVPRRLTLMQLGPRSCRWCVNDPEPGAAGHLFCGETTDIGKSYCGYHAALSVGEGTRSEQDADRALRRAA